MGKNTDFDVNRTIKVTKNGTKQGVPRKTLDESVHQTIYYL